MASEDAVDHWHRPLVQVRGQDLLGDTGQTSGMNRREAISGKNTGSEKLWMGQTHVAPGVNSGDHHHGEAETAIYVLAGRPAFVFAEGDQEIRLRPSPAITSSCRPTCRTGRRIPATRKRSWS
jgi:uncharacterized RmlC-like cupin family protein